MYLGFYSYFYNFKKDLISKKNKLGMKLIVKGKKNVKKNF